MKQVARATGLSVLFFFFALVTVRSQNRAPKYVDIAFIKSKSADFIKNEKELWVPIHKQLVSDGKKIAWYLYKVKYPTGSSADYDYVQFNVFADWSQVESPSAGLSDATKKVHPKVDTAAFIKNYEHLREITWDQLFQVIDEAAVKVDNPSKFIVVNQVKSVAGSESEYVKMELAYFKPFHAERVGRGIMNNWSLYKPVMPYGEKYPYDYVTLNGFSTWQQITANNPPDVWKKVHGDVDFDAVHTKILQKRITVNNEVWELVASSME